MLNLFDKADLAKAVAMAYELKESAIECWADALREDKAHLATAFRAGSDLHLALRCWELVVGLPVEGQARGESE